MATTSLDQEQNKFVQSIQTSGEILLTVINDILDFSRIERSELELEHIPFNLAELIGACAQSFQHSAVQRGLALNLRIPDDMRGLQVQGDPTRIRQILVNLVGNALKFTDKGGVTMKIVSALDTFTVSVTDTGPGIAADMAGRLFKPFETGKSAAVSTHALATLK